MTLAGEGTRHAPPPKTDPRAREARGGIERKSRRKREPSAFSEKVARYSAEHEGRPDTFRTDLKRAMLALSNPDEELRRREIHWIVVVCSEVLGLLRGAAAGDWPGVPPSFAKRLLHRGESLAGPPSISYYLGPEGSDWPDAPPSFDRRLLHRVPMSIARLAMRRVWLEDALRAMGRHMEFSIYLGPTVGILNISRDSQLVSEPRAAQSAQPLPHEN